MTPPTVESPIRARLGGPLKLAIPRGALWGETLDALDGIGLETAEMRGDSRSLVFDMNGLTLVTMRPSDVPTYVEAGAADLGITGKDVLLEQQGDRIVYEILDLAYGACRMVLAGRRGDQSLGESERRVGGMRIATKYPRTAERHFDQTGRHADVIEVKGSVELAPLIGLADGIVDLVATGRTLKENGLEIREEIATSTARLISNRVSHKLRAVEVDDLVERLRPEGADEVQALRLGRPATPSLWRAEVRALQPALGEVSEPVAGDHRAEVRRGRRSTPSPRSRPASAAGTVAPDSIRVTDERSA